MNDFLKVWFVGKRKKKLQEYCSSNSCTLLCHFYLTHFSLSEQSPTAFRLLPGSLPCSQQISRIFCVEVSVWYICSKSASITQPTGGRWKEREIRQRTNFFSPPCLKIASVLWATVVFVKKIRWWLFWFKVVRTDFSQARGVRSNQTIYQLWGLGYQNMTRLGHKVSISLQHQLTLAQSATPSSLSLHRTSHQFMLGCWAACLVRGHWVLQPSKVKCSCF